VKRRVCGTCIILALLLAAATLWAGGQTEGSKEGELHIGFATRETTAPFSQAMILAAKEKAKALGVKLTVLSSDNDNQRHLSIMDNFITMGIDGFICGGVIDPGAIVPGIKKMNEQNIPVIAIDNSPLGGKIDYFISFDIGDMSAKAANFMIGELKKRNGGQVPSGVLIEIMGDLLEGWASISTAGFHSVIDNYPQLKVVQGSGEWNNDDSFRQTANFMTRFGGEVKAIFVHTPDIMGVGAVNAIRQAGFDPKNIVSSGLCIGPEGIELLKKGEFTGIIEQPIYAAGEMSVDLLVKIMKKQPVPKVGDTLTEKGALWSPAEVVPNPYGPEGAYIKLSAPMVPQEVSPDDPRLWENAVFKK
jgi:ribose transport system substrate-binding protein